MSENTSEISIKLDTLSNHCNILDYDLHLSDSDIDELNRMDSLVNDLDYCYDDYFSNKKEGRENEN